MIAREEFISHLKDALIHLHNADRLRRSSLTQLFGISDRFDSSARLRAILTEGIQSLRPIADDSGAEQAWRVYDSLFCCYVQQLSQRVAADQLGISARQLRREQRIALEALADVLWPRIDQAKGGRADGAAHRPGAQLEPEEENLVEELLWLRDTAPTGPTCLRDQLADALSLVEPLAQQCGVRVSVVSAEPLAETSAHPVAVCQTLVGLLGVAIARCRGGGEVRVATEESSWHIDVIVSCGAAPGRHPMSENGGASLDMSHRLAELCGGRLSFADEPDVFSATLSLPAYQQLPVLVIDDNADALQLMRRYVSHTRYRLISTRDPLQAIDLAHAEKAQLIVLDVMMPNLDGWHVLAQLRQHPKTNRIPVVVCTILPEKALALSLGASGFVRKPATREVFLAELDRQAGLLGSELRSVSARTLPGH